MTDVNVWKANMQFNFQKRASKKVLYTLLFLWTHLASAIMWSVTSEVFPLNAALCTSSFPAIRMTAAAYNYFNSEPRVNRQTQMAAHKQVY